MPDNCFIDDHLDDLICEFSTAGVQRILLAKWSNVLWGTVTKDADGQITAIPMKVDTFFYEVPPEYNAGYTAEYQQSGSNKYFNESVQFTVPGYSTAVKKQMEKLFKGSRAAVLVQRKSGTWVLLGETGGIKATAGTASSGVAEGDEAGVAITLSGTNNGMPSIVDKTIIDALIAP